MNIVTVPRNLMFMFSPAERFETTRTAIYPRLAFPEEMPNFYTVWSSVRDQLDHPLNAFHNSDYPTPDWILLDERWHQRQQAIGA